VTQDQIQHVRSIHGGENRTVSEERRVLGRKKGRGAVVGDSADARCYGTRAFGMGSLDHREKGRSRRMGKSGDPKTKDLKPDAAGIA